MVIALKGPSQCGKSTLAKLLSDHYTAAGYPVVRTSFGDFVREEVVDAIIAIRDCEFTEQIPDWMQNVLYRWRFNTRAEILNWLTRRPADHDSRAIQQWWGQDFRRAQDPLYWIKKSFTANVHHLLDPDTYLIEESCRQLNEGQYIHALGGVVLDLVPLQPPTESEAAAQSHSVEQAAMSWEGDLKVNMADYFNRPEGACPVLHTERFLAPITVWISQQNRSTCARQTASRTLSSSPETIHQWR